MTARLRSRLVARQDEQDPDRIASHIAQVAALLDAGGDLADLSPDQVAAIAGLLLSADEIAPLIGLTSAGGVRAYMTRYPNFPRPVLPHDLANANGRSLYWWAPEVVRWRAEVPTRRRSGDNPTDPS